MFFNGLKAFLDQKLGVFTKFCGRTAFVMVRTTFLYVVPKLQTEQKGEGCNAIYYSRGVRRHQYDIHSRQKSRSSEKCLQELEDVYEDVSGVVVDSLTEGANTIAQKVVSLYLFYFHLCIYLCLYLTI